MTSAFALLCGLIGAVLGWCVFQIVDRRAPLPEQFRGRGHVQWLSIVVSGLLVLSLAMKFGLSPILIVYSALALVLVGVTVFDIRKQQIPHVVTVPGTIVGLLLGTFVLPLGLMESALGMAVGGGVLLISTIVEALRKKEIGGGDWKYAAMIGSFIGWQRIIVALVFTGLFGFVGALVLRASGTEGKPQALGPWLSAGAMASILFT